MKPWDQDRIARIRSLFIAIRSMRRVGRYGDSVGVGLRVDADGACWRFFHKGMQAEYWPATGQLIFGSDKPQIVCVPVPFGVRRALRIIRDCWRLPRDVELPRLIKPKNLSEKVRKYVAAMQVAELVEEQRRARAIEIENKRQRDKEEAQRLARKEDHRQWLREQELRRSQEEQQRIQGHQIRLQRQLKMREREEYRRQQPVPVIKPKTYDATLVNAKQEFGESSVFYRSTGGGRRVCRTVTPGGEYDETNPKQYYILDHLPDLEVELLGGPQLGSLDTCPW